MDIVFNGGEIQGTVTAPPSKSCTHRAILLATLSEDRCIIRNPLISDDTAATIEAVESMGASVTIEEDRIAVECKRLHAPDKIIDARNSGTTLRLMTGISALFPISTTLIGDESLSKRPMGALIDTLESCGVKCKSNKGCSPIRIKGPIDTDKIDVDGSMSSQFVSSLLMASPMIGKRIRLKVDGATVSKPYIDMTIDMMRSFGAKVESNHPKYYVEPGGYTACNINIPGDWSSASLILAAGALSGKVTVKGLNSSIYQGDIRILDILRDAGCSIDVYGDTVTCSSPGRLNAVNVDLSNNPDLFPIAAVLMSTAKGTSRLYGAPHLRFKETDRIASTVSILRTLGANIIDTDDGCIIQGVNHLKGGRIEHRGDHRLMMSAAIASLVSEGTVSMEDDGCWNVSYPEFLESVRSIGMRC